MQLSAGAEVGFQEVIMEWDTGTCGRVGIFAVIVWIGAMGIGLDRDGSRKVRIIEFAAQKG